MMIRRVDDELRDSGRGPAADQSSAEEGHGGRAGAHNLLFGK